MGACLVTELRGSKAIGQKQGETIPVQQPKTQTTIDPSPKVISNHQKEEDIISEKSLKMPIEVQNSGPVDDSLAGKYRRLLKEEMLGYVNNLPNSMFRVENTALHVIKYRRLAKEIPKFAGFLPCEHTNAIFVRVNESQINSMNVLISGSAGTPYAHGLYHFELYCDETFPIGPPKMQILTGKGKVRFNPNMYQCGKICLSLLGTWAGSPEQMWNPAKSTLFQIFVSIQSLIMTEDVYFNEPGFEYMKDTPNGKLNNEGYSNVVKLANIRFAMIDMIKKPPIGFEAVVRKHFSIKKDEILQQCEKWMSQKDRPFMTCSQNPHYQSMMMTTGYRNMLEKQINELKEVLSTLSEQS